MNESFTSPDARGPAKSGQHGRSGCAHVMNDPFMTSRDAEPTAATLPP
ncbi:hypothetical protein H4696_004891 [Amycolatopsis lexingtonensis]|uniref:Uncharacterized protein n=1 Tax=Amycolatopsis lexingtonensis TaxID=218822 RepID=A0ABR9I3K7_9PSEU|nr:hypothetical protein [Amycolatopsis lexingtonensis]